MAWFTSSLPGLRALQLGLVLTLAGAWQSAPARPALPEVSLKHLEHLTRPARVEGKQVLAVWIYAEAPDYRPVDDDDEGFACVDDTARAVVAALMHAERTGSKRAEELARGALGFVLAMQAEDGQFYNFVLPGGGINRTGPTSRKGHGWWAARAIWALGSGVRYFEKRDPALAAKLLAAAERLLPWYRKVLKRYGKRRKVEGVEVPDWLVAGASDTSSEVVLGLLELHAARPGPELAEMIAKLCDGMVELRVREKGTPLFGAHASTTKKPRAWHHWGSRQTMALARAYRTLKKHPRRTRWLESARAEADHFFARLLATHVPEAIEGAKVKPYPQIAYGINSLVLGFLEVHRATGEPRYLDLARRAFAWYEGANPAQVRMYDPKTGRCFDGIVDAKTVNRNSGAESTIEALLAIEEMSREAK